MDIYEPKSPTVPTMEKWLGILNQIGAMECILINPNRPAYHYEQRRLKWGEDISPENMERLKNAEVFMLEDKQGADYKLIFKDAHGTIRESKVFA